MALRNAGAHSQRPFLLWRRIIWTDLFSLQEQCLVSRHWCRWH
jgi:hypothetical protein